MNAVSMNKTSKKIEINDFFEAAKLVSLLSLIASIEMYIMGIFTTVTLPAVLLFAFLTFLAVQHAKKEKISGVSYRCKLRILRHHRLLIRKDVH